MEYDSAGRVTKQTLSDNREILYDYDANGNLTSLTPPGRPSHTFFHTPVNLTELYVPPVTEDSSGVTFYDYNLDRQITNTILSEQDTISVTYGSAGCGCGNVGSVAKISFDRGDTFFKYDSTTGQLRHIISPENDTLSYTYDGSLPTSVSWKGSVNGSVGVTYDNDFRVTSQSVNGGNTVSYLYDDDGLLTSAGDLSINHTTQNGLVTGSSLGNVTTSYSYNAFGEVTAFNAKYGNENLFTSDYSLDSLGRITEITENIFGKTNTYSYSYDLSGRLIQVNRNDTTISVYTYDDNGNRLSLTSLSGTVLGTYDDQDRLLTYGDASYGTLKTVQRSKMEEYRMISKRISL